MPRPIKDFQDAIMTVVADDDELIGLDEIGAERGDIITRIKKNIARLGVFVVWEVDSASSKDAMGKMGLKILATIEENPTLNRTTEGYLAWDSILLALWTGFAKAGLMKPESWRMIDNTSGHPTAQIEFSTNAAWKRT